MELGFLSVFFFRVEDQILPVEGAGESKLFVLPMSFSFLALGINTGPTLRESEAENRDEYKKLRP